MLFLNVVILIKRLCKKGDKCECSNYKGISFIYKSSKLLCIIEVIALRRGTEGIKRRTRGFGKRIH